MCLAMRMVWMLPNLYAAVANNLCACADAQNFRACEDVRGKEFSRGLRRHEPCPEASSASPHQSLTQPKTRQWSVSGRHYKIRIAIGPHTSRAEAALCIEVQSSEITAAANGAAAT